MIKPLSFIFKYLLKYTTSPLFFYMYIIILAYSIYLVIYYLLHFILKSIFIALIIILCFPSIRKTIYNFIYNLPWLNIVFKLVQPQETREIREEGEPIRVEKDIIFIEKDEVCGYTTSSKGKCKNRGFCPLHYKLKLLESMRIVKKMV